MAASSAGRSFSRRGRLIVDIVGLALFLLPGALFLAWLSWPVFAQAWMSGETSPNYGGLIRWPILLAPRPPDRRYRGARPLPSSRRPLPRLAELAGLRAGLDERRDLAQLWRPHPLAD